MKIWIPALLALCLLAQACQNEDTKKTGVATPGQLLTDPAVLEGNWIADDLVQRMVSQSSVAAALRSARSKPYAYAFTFLPRSTDISIHMQSFIHSAYAFTFLQRRPDSVLCYDHSRRWLAPVRFNADTIELPGVVEGKSIYMVYQTNPEKAFMMYDATGGELVQHYYVATREKTVNGYVAFATSLNHNLLGGGFKVLKGGDPKKNVVFMPPGNLYGLADFDSYQICSGGDCLLAGDKIDAIFLANRKAQKGGWYGFRFSADRDTMTFFNLKSDTPKEKGSYQVGAEVFKLLRLPKPVPGETPAQKPKPAAKAPSSKPDK